MSWLHRLRLRVVPVAFLSFLLTKSTAVSVAAEANPLAALPAEGSVPVDGGGKKTDLMMELLGWATKNSDPERVKELVQKMEDSNLTIKDIYGQDVYDALFVDEAHVMIKSIQKVADYKNSSMEDDELETALNELQDMIEQIDNAGNLHSMGGLVPLLDLAVGDDRNVDIQALALWTFGVAVGNNQPVQDAARHIGAIERLVKLLGRCGSASAVGVEGGQYCSKLLLAISGVIKNDSPLQVEADKQGLFAWLLDFGVGHRAAAVAKKSLGLLDICLAQTPELRILETLPDRQDTIASMLLQHVRNGDNDTAEKGLTLINRLLSLRPFLFGPEFREQLRSAAKHGVATCEADLGDDGAEICEGLSGIASSIDRALAARELGDEEL